MVAKTKTLKAVSRGRLPEGFAALVALMPAMAIRGDVQHENMVSMIDRLMQVEQLSRGQTDYLETLLQLVQSYEAKHHAIDVGDLHGVRMLKRVMEQSGMSGSDLGRLLGIHPTMGSKILNGERRLTWEHAKNLAGRFKVAASLFME